MPSFNIEDQEYGVVAGIDEAGRGPLCGPVYAACSIIINHNNFPANIDDSKKISEKKRSFIFNDIMEFAKQGLLFYGIGIVDNYIIDEINIRNATKLAMKNAYEDLINKCKFKIDCVIVDGNFIPDIDTKALPIIKGDQKSFSISCASIIAKVSRDMELYEMAKKFPMYDWENNKGYGTKNHIKAIQEYGLTDYHRKSFCKNFL